jgi:uncharacterized protein
MSSECAVTFANSKGDTLFGIVHRPQRARTDIGMVLLSPGIKSRVAPHRLYVKMARHFAARGITVLRFDFAGLGDSTGAVDDTMLANLYRSIQLGRYTDDTLRAIDWMREHAGVDRVVLGGLCGGAITGLLAARRSAHVAGLLGIGLPVVLDGTAVDQVANMTVGQLRSLRERYFGKLLNAAAWWRVLTLKTDFRLVFRSLLLSRLAGTMTSPSGTLAVLGDNGNPEFPPAFLDLLRRQRPLLLMFSGADRLAWEFEEKFADPHRAAIAPFAAILSVAVIEKANHVLTFPAWQEEMLTHSDRWLEKHFPVGAGTTTIRSSALGARS